MKVEQFMSEEFKDFSIYDAYRSIPSMVDGFKPSQRKIIFGTLKRGESAGEIKVAQLGAYIASVAAYHHGEGSLMGAIVGLAQNYPGSNNINFLEPEGQFGSILTNQSAAPRYIFTKLTDSFRKIFKKEDDLILNFLQDDGTPIEPDYYLPIIPTVLVNGSVGMGTGYASRIKSYSPKDIISNIKKVLKGRTQKPLVPWYNGFDGNIRRDESGQVVISGILEVINTTTIKISALPINTYLAKYKEHLNKLEDDGVIKDFDDNSTEDGFEFVINCPRTTTSMSIEKLYDKFKLISRDTENYTLWNEHGKIKVYDSVEHIISDFTEFRLAKYEERRLALLKKYNDQLLLLQEKHRFIKYYIENASGFSKKNKAELIEMLKTKLFVNIDILLNIKIYNMTGDALEALEKDIEDTKHIIEGLNNTTSTEMYTKELEDLSKQL